ncbi:MAG: serine/threonine-protein kinase [Burkholderiales bacterium]
MDQKTFGRYRVVAELGRGAMGTVYRAVDPLIEREVAIKTLLPNLPEEVMAEVRERFLREAKSAGRMNHPHVVTIFDVGEQDGVAYMAMEILQGRSLQQILREEPRLPFERIADLVAQVAEALDYAQEFRIVHRDVKPANIMVNPAWRAKLVDFGVAYVPSSTMTQTGTALGSPRYMSPEQVLGLPIDPRSDIFSLGVVLYEMLTRKTPFERPSDTTVFALMNRIAGEPHPPAREVDPSIPAGFDVILDRALAKKAEDRYARAGEMAADLRNYQSLGAAGGARPAAAQGGDTMAVPRQAPAAAAPAYEKTVAVATAPRAETLKDDKERSKLLADLDHFAQNFEAQEKAALLAEQEERRRKEEALHKWGETEARKRAEFELKIEGGAASDSSPSMRRSAALDMLRKQAAAQPPRVDKAKQKFEQDSALDKSLRGAFQYLAEFVKQLNEVGPSSGKPYDFIYLGKIPAPAISDAFVDMRLRKIEGKDFCDHLIFRFRVTPELPVTTRLLGPDIGRLQQYLGALRVPFEMKEEAKDDFGKATRAIFRVSASLPCEAILRGDYDNGTVVAELTNVRRPGRVKAQFSASTLDDVADDFARYVLGADDDFAKLFTR